MLRSKIYKLFEKAKVEPLADPAVLLFRTTTVYPVGAVSVTSTCALGAIVVPDTPSKNKHGFPLPPPAKPQVWVSVFEQKGSPRQDRRS